MLIGLHRAFSRVSCLEDKHGKRPRLKELEDGQVVEPRRDVQREVSVAGRRLHSREEVVNCSSHVDDGGSAISSWLSIDGGVVGRAPVISGLADGDGCEDAAAAGDVAEHERTADEDSHGAGGEDMAGVLVEEGRPGRAVGRILEETISKEVFDDVRRIDISQHPPCQRLL